MMNCNYMGENFGRRLCGIAAAAFALLAVPAVSYGQDNAASGGAAMGFLVRNTDPASLGAGGTSLTGSGAAYSLFGNPAGMAFSGTKLDVAASYSSWQPDGASANVIDFGVAGSFGKFGICAGISYGMGAGYDIYDASGQKSGTFSPNEMVAGAGLSWRIVKFLSVGVNLKYATEKLAEGSSYGTFAADALVMGKFGDFRVTAGARNFGGKVKAADGTSFSIPSSVAAGVSFDHTFAGKHCLGAALNGDCYFEGGAVASIGAGYTYNDLVSVRAGYSNASGKAPAASFASIGAGVHFFGIRLDFAYLIASSDSPLANTFSVGLGYSF